MNVLALRLFQPALIALAGALLAQIILAIALASGIAALPTAQLDVAPFRWA